MIRSATCAAPREISARVGGRGWVGVPRGTRGRAGPLAHEGERAAAACGRRAAGRASSQPSNGRDASV